MAEEILELEVNSNVKGVIKDVDNLGDAVESTNASYKKLNRTVGKTNKSQKDADKLIMRSIGNFRVFGVSIRSIRENFKLLRPLSKKLFMTIKSGIAATGIGILVIAFGVLMGALMGTKKGAKLLDLAMQGIKKALAPLIWIIEKVADGLAALFGIDSTTAVTAAEKLEQAYEKLGREMDKIALREEKGKKAKFDLQKIVDDTTKSEKERLAAHKKIAEFDYDTLQAKITAQEKVLTAAKKAQEQARQDWNWEKQKAIDKNNWEEVQADKESGFSVDRAAHHKANKKLQEAEIALIKLQTQVHTDAADIENEIFTIKSFNIGELADDRAKAAAKRLKAEADWLAKQKKKAADELSIAKQLEKIKQELYYRTLKTVEEVEAAKLKDANDAAKQAILDSTASKKVKDAAIKELDIKYFDDLAIIVDKYADKAEEETKVAEEKLADLKEANRIKALEDETEQALAELQIQKDKEDEALKSFENYAELKVELDKKYLGLEADINEKASDKQIEIDKATADAKAKIRDANLSNIDAGIALVKSLAGESKGLMAASIVAENAAGIAKILINTAVANAKALTLGPLAPATIVANNISAGIGIASSIAATAKGLSALGEGGATGGGNPDGDVSSVPPAPEMMSGAFTLGGGQEVEPARAYVVSDDITNNQNKLAIIRRRATI